MLIGYTSSLPQAYDNTSFTLYQCIAVIWSCIPSWPFHCGLLSWPPSLTWWAGSCNIVLQMAVYDSTRWRSISVLTHNHTFLTPAVLSITTTLISVPVLASIYVIIAQRLRSRTRVGISVRTAFFRRAPVSLFYRAREIPSLARPLNAIPQGREREVTSTAFRIRRTFIASNYLFFVVRYPKTFEYQIKWFNSYQLYLTRK
jgi:hypothetical protein